MIEIINQSGIVNLDLKNNDKVLIKDSNITLYEKNKNNYTITFEIINSNVLYFSYDYSNEIFDINREYNLYKNSNLEIVNGFFGRGNTKNKINLLESFSSADLKTVAIAKDDELKINIEMNHLAPDTKGINENYAISKLNAKIKYDVIGKINKGMKRSKCSQKTRGIVVNDGVVEADPVLLIDEYDVQANHGACIGKISDEGLFYLMSRGINKEEALILIVNGFLNPIYNLIPDENYKNDFINSSKLQME